MTFIAPIRLSLLAALASLSAVACAGDGLVGAKQEGKLVAGINFVVPEYRAGAKFRTPEAIDTALVEDLAQRLRRAPATVRTAPGSQANLLASGKADIVLATLADNDSLLRSATVVPIAYTAAPMAIMRSDTDIKRWDQLKGRKVCVSEGGLYVGTLAAKYGAIEKVQRAPADSLLALRIGECDAAVHDSALLEELIKLPEWKKFSARLPAGPRSTLAFVTPATDAKSAALLKQIAQEWAASATPQRLTKKAVQHIAFEVYLDQDVPDCH
jgi:polar amino acid transport system substrate-binding protein